MTATSVNDNPTVSTIVDQTLPANTTTSLPLTVGDVETPAGSLTVTALSSNTTVIPNSGLVPGGSDASRTLAITPTTNQSGSATITVTVTDANSDTVTTTFVATVLPNLTIADAAVAN